MTSWNIISKWCQLLHSICTLSCQDMPCLLFKLTSFLVSSNSCVASSIFFCNSIFSVSFKLRRLWLWEWHFVRNILDGVSVTMVTYKYLVFCFFLCSIAIKLCQQFLMLLIKSNFIMAISIINIFQLQKEKNPL